MIENTHPRIAYMMSAFPALTETFVLYEILALGKLGIQVEIYPLLTRRESVDHPEAARLAGQTHYAPFISRRILASNWRFVRRSPRRYLGSLVEVLKGTLGSANFFVGAIGIFPKVVCFADEMQRAGITHVHAHFANHPALAAFLVHRLTGIPYSFTAHGSDLHADRHMLDKKVESAKVVVTISRYNQEVIVRDCGEQVRGKIRLVHCGVDPQVFSPQSRNGNGTPFQLLSVAALKEKKGHRYLVQACSILENRGINFVCHIVGGGPLYGAVKKQIAAAGLSDRVVMHGPLPRNDVAQRLSEADVLVLPSIRTRKGKLEGIPVVLMEAMASGVPVVATRLSGIPELVDHLQTGLLTPPADPVALADALNWLYDNRSLAQEFGKAGRRKVLDEFDLYKNAARLAQVLVGCRESHEMRGR